jgi:hypothetical protein
VAEGGKNSVFRYREVSPQSVKQLVETPRWLGRLAPRSEGEINDNNKGDAAGFTFGAVAFCNVQMLLAVVGLLLLLPDRTSGEL